VLLGISLIAAPAVFASGPRDVAGAVVRRMFAQEAYLSLALGIVLLVLVRAKARTDAAAGAGSVFSTDLMLVLGTLFCTVAGYFAVQPMIEAARVGQGSLSFGTLHAVSAIFFGTKALLAAVLAWRGHGPVSRPIRRLSS
jgi:hypothetical protein